MFQPILMTQNNRKLLAVNYFIMIHGSSLAARLECSQRNSKQNNNFRFFQTVVSMSQSRTLNFKFHFVEKVFLSVRHQKFSVSFSPFLSWQVKTKFSTEWKIFLCMFSTQKDGAWSITWKKHKRKNWDSV